MTKPSKSKVFIRQLVFFLAQSFISLNVVGQEQSAEELAIKFSNPIANLISVPFQNGIDFGIGKNNGAKNILNIQPVIPFHLTPKLNLVTRYVVPIIAQYDITDNGTKQTGVSDVLVSAFFSPAAVKNGFTWGLGPAFSLPIASNDYFGSKQFGVGPTIIALRQISGWTYGLLANQIWSTAKDENKVNMNQGYLQPFLSYNFKSGATLGGNNEIGYNWNSNTTNAYLHLYINCVTKIGNQSVLVGGGPRICYAAPDNARPDFGMRFLFVLMFPK